VRLRASFGGLFALEQAAIDEDAVPSTETPLRQEPVALWRRISKGTGIAALVYSAILSRFRSIPICTLWRRREMTRFALSIAATVVALAAGLSARADEVTDQLEAARKAYDAGELRSAVQTLQFAVAKIQEKINASLRDLLPRPLPGWTADTAEAQSGGIASVITGTMLSRRYHRDDGAEVEVSVMADSPLLPMMTMMLSSPMLLQSDPNAQIYTYGGERGMIQHEAGSDRWEIRLLLGSKILVQVTASGVTDREPAEAYLKAINLKALQKAFAG
jgi:hypothetical protein